MVLYIVHDFNEEFSLSMIHILFFYTFFYTCDCLPRFTINYV